MNTGNNQVNKFVKTIFKQNFIATISMPTIIIKTQISLIDYIFTDAETFKNDNEIITGNIYSNITNHLLNFIIIKLSKTNTQNERPLVRLFGDKKKQIQQSLQKHLGMNFMQPQMKIKQLAYFT